MHPALPQPGIIAAAGAQQELPYRLHSAHIKGKLPPIAGLPPGTEQPKAHKIAGAVDAQLTVGQQRHIGAILCLPRLVIIVYPTRRCQTRQQVIFRSGGHRPVAAHLGIVPLLLRHIHADFADAQRAVPDIGDALPVQKGVRLLRFILCAVGAVEFKAHIPSRLGGVCFELPLIPGDIEFLRLHHPILLSVQVSGVVRHINTNEVGCIHTALVGGRHHKVLQRIGLPQIVGQRQPIAPRCCEDRAGGDIAVLTQLTIGGGRQHGIILGNPRIFAPGGGHPRQQVRTLQHCGALVQPRPAAFRCRCPLHRLRLRQHQSGRQHRQQQRGNQHRGNAATFAANRHTLSLLSVKFGPIVCNNDPYTLIIACRKRNFLSVLRKLLHFFRLLLKNRKKYGNMN